MKRPWAALTAALQSDDGRLVRRIVLEYGGRHWRGYAIAIGLAAIVGGCTAATAYLLGKVANSIYLDRNFPAVVVVSISIVVLCLAKGLATFGHARMLARVTYRIAAESQRQIVDKLLRHNLGFFANRHSSEFMAAAQHGAAATGNVLSMLVLALGRDVITLLGLILVMVWQDPFLSLIGLAVMPPAVFGVRKLMVRAGQIASTQFTGIAALQQTMQEMVQGLRVIKTFNLEDQVRARAAVDIASMERASNKLAIVSNRSAPLVEALGGLAIAMLCLYGGYRMLETNATPGEFVAFMTAFLLAFDPARRIAKLNVDLTTGLVGARVLLDLLDAPATEPDDSAKPALVVGEGRIEFDDVWFEYREGQPVLSGATFTAEPHVATALVGPSGGGKSTIFSLLLGLYGAGRGSIRIDGRPLGETSRRSLRDAIAYVGQDIFLFRGTIRDNIMLGRPNGSEAEMEAAAKAAFAHDFIMSFHAGYDTQVGELGGQLSLGQRQRIAVARALIKNAPIILLDEPTAALDSESEHHVQEAIRHLCAGRTTLVIAHRLNTIRDADCIYVLEGGRILETGRHGELMSRNGRYAQFVALQFPEAHGMASRQPERSSDGKSNLAADT